MNNREANQSSLRAVPKLSVIISASVSIRREQRTYLRNNGAASSADPVASARIGSVVVPVIVVGRQTLTFSVTSSSTFQSLSSALYKTTRTDLNRHVRGVCSPSKGIVNVASIAMFTASWLRQKEVPTKRLTASRRYPGCICNPDRVKILAPAPPHQETAPATRTPEQKNARQAPRTTLGIQDGSRQSQMRTRVLCSEGRGNALRDRRGSLVNHEDREPKEPDQPRQTTSSTEGRKVTHDIAQQVNLREDQPSIPVGTRPQGQTEGRVLREMPGLGRARWPKRHQVSAGRQRSGCIGTITIIRESGREKARFLLDWSWTGANAR